MSNWDTSTKIAPLDNPFWQFSLIVYQDKSIKELSHALQDNEGVNVNLLLYCCWLAYAVENISEKELHLACQSIADWHDEVTTVLRQARRSMGQLGPQDVWRKDFFKRVLLDEILSESYQQEFLYQMFQCKQKIEPNMDTERAYCYLSWLFEYMGNPIDADKKKLLQNFVARVSVALGVK